MSAHQLITEHLDLWTQAFTQKSTAGRGRNGKVELTGIKKLRELILELAFTGKLVEQNSNAESAEVLLARLKDERSELEKSKKIKKKRKPNESTNIDNLTALPSNWCWSQLGEIAFKLTDGSHNPPRDAGSGVPMLSSQNVNSGRIDFERPSRYVTFEDYVKEDNRTEARPGDVLLTIVASLGRSAVVPQEAPQFVLQRSVAVISTPMSSEFLAYQFIAPQCLAYYDTHGKGTAQKGIYLGKLAVMPIAVPPLEEQHRIVQKVDELMALCDRLEQQTSNQLDAHETLVDTLLGTLTQSANATELADSWSRLAEHFDTLFTTEQSIDKFQQTILQLAVIGRLVEQDAEDEPAINLLTRIHTRKTTLAGDKRIKQPRPLTLLKNSEHSYIAPAHWAWASFQDVADEISTGPFGSIIHKHDYVEGGIPLINPSHMIKGHIKEDLSVSVSLAKAEELSSYRLTNGDIVMARRGEVGRCAAVTDREAGWLCGTGSFVLRFHPAINRQFILLLFATDTVRNYLTGNSVGTTMTNLNHGILKKMPVAVPPAEEQYRIVQKVDELMAICDHLKQRLTQASNTRCQLAGAVVEQAIS